MLVAAGVLCLLPARGVSARAASDEWAHEPWCFIRIPGLGVAPLSEALTPGSVAHGAMLVVGAPLEAYEPVSVFSVAPDAHNAGVLIYVLGRRCLGDFNGDGRVDVYDAGLFMEAYLREAPEADLSLDGVIDARDQMVFMLLSSMPCVDAWSL